MRGGVVRHLGLGPWRIEYGVPGITRTNSTSSNKSNFRMCTSPANTIWLPFSPEDIALRAVVSKEFATTGLLHFQKALWGATSSPSSSGKGPATRMGFCPALNTVRHGRLIVGLSLLAPVSFLNVVSSTP